MEKLKKQSSTLKTGLNFEFLLGRTLRVMKPVQVSLLHVDNFKHVPYSIVSNKVSAVLQT